MTSNLNESRDMTGNPGFRGGFRIEPGYLLSGFLEGDIRIDAPVVIKLNDVPITTTMVQYDDTAEAGDTPVYIFRRPLALLASYVGADDRITVEHDGHVLEPVEENGPVPVGSGASRASALVEQLEQGLIIDKYGRLIRSLSADLEWQANTFDLFETLKSNLYDEFGVVLFPIYGTMLGAVRNGAFISQDNDFDTTYVSRHTARAEVRAEFAAIYRYLQKTGYRCRAFRTHTHVRSPGTSRDPRKLDIFFSYFNKDGAYQIPYGWHGPEAHRADFEDMVEMTLANYVISIPRGYRRILEQLYGPSWERPDPGFTHKSPTRKRDKRFLLSRRKVKALRKPAAPPA